MKKVKYKAVEGQDISFILSKIINESKGNAATVGYVHVVDAADNVLAFG